MPRDYYEVLGVQRGADKQEIKSAFRKLARQYHPDVSEEQDAEAKFKEINEAYEVLSNDEKRQRYDHFGHAGINGANGFGASAAGFGFEDIFDIFNSTFGGTGAGGGRRRRTPGVGGDKRADVTIEFEEAVFGVEKEIEYQRLESCEVCSGAGAAEGSHPVTCPQCNGTGEVRQVQQTFLGSMVRVATCPQCGGNGTIISNPCNNCQGSGRLRKKAVLNVKIPAGVSEGLQIQVRGEGDAGERGAPSGNLYVVVHVKEHKFFKHRENDIILDININIAQAALGDKIRVDTVDGLVELGIPPGTQTGKVFRLRGKGIPRLRSDGSNSGRGDQLVYIQVETPTTLTTRQRELFEELAESFGGDIVPQPNGRGFFDKVMDFLGGEPKA